MWDTLIVGSGPTGLSIAQRFQQEGISILVIEKGMLAQNIYRFPEGMRFFSSKERLILGGFPLQCKEEKPTREEYLTYLRSFVEYFKIPVRLYTEVMEIQPKNSHFQIFTRNLWGEEKSFLAKTIVLSVGAYENPNYLGIEGEDLPHVSHFFPGVHPYFQSRVLIIGGGNSAVEAALLLYRHGAKEVHIAYHKESFSREKIKYWLLPDIEGRIKKKEIFFYPRTKIKKITPKGALLYQEEREFFIECDFILLLTGYTPPIGFFQKIGLKIHSSHSLPVFDPENLESSIHGIFIAGYHPTPGYPTLIEESRYHGEKILKRLSFYL